jgi:AcrR family transcriptional regulator
MRRIATEAQVAQALLHYHFATKDQLYEAVFERRSSAINALREAGLDRIFADGRSATLEEVLEALFAPVPSWPGSRTQPATYFAPMVSAISIGEDDRSKGLMVRHYDPIARRFIEAFRRVLPGLAEPEAVWAYLFALGARIQTNMQNGRAARLGAGDGEVQPRFVAFVAAGIRALAAMPKDQRT